MAVVTPFETLSRNMFAIAFTSCCTVVPFAFSSCATTVIAGLTWRAISIVTVVDPQRIKFTSTDLPDDRPSIAMFPTYSVRVQRVES